MGAVIDGCPPKMELSAEDIQKELDRRRPGHGKGSSPRREKDRVEILSGVFAGKTTGTPISLMVRNEDVDSGPYEELKDVFRPGQADFTYQAKYGIRDYRGGGRASARETVGRVAAGAIAKKILEMEKIEMISYRGTGRDSSGKDGLPGDQPEPPALPGRGGGETDGEKN